MNIANASLRIKNGRYYAVIIYYDENGKRQQKWISMNLPAKNNKRKAEAMLFSVVANFEKSPGQTPPKELPKMVKFTDVISKWLDSKKDVVEKSTWEGYEIYAQKHIIPFFSHLDLDIKEVQPHHIRSYYDSKFRAGRLDKKQGGLSIVSLKKHAMVLRSILSYAVECKYIDKNPAEGIKLPKKEAAAPERTFLNAEQARYILSLFEGNRLYPIVYFTLYYGLRRSEVLGLKWDAIDLKNKKMSICHTVVKNVTIIEKDRTKNEASRDTYVLIDEAVDMLKKIKKEQIEMRAFYKSDYEDSGYVFTWPNGTPYRPDYLTKAFQKTLANAGMPHMRFHDLRHSTASILHDLGWDIKDIQMWLRHQSAETTTEIYTHISKDRRKKMATELSNALTKKNNDI